MTGVIERFCCFIMWENIDLVILTGVGKMYPRWQTKKKKQKKNIENIWLVSLFNGISTFVGSIIAKPLSKKNSSGTI